MAKLVVGNLDTQIVGTFPKGLLDKALSFHAPGYWFSPQFQSGRWDGKVHLLKRDTFPTGLLYEATQVLGDCELVDRRFYSDAKRGIFLKGVELRRYQTATILRMLRARRGVVEIPTGGGKTLICAGVISALNCKTLYVVHTKTLLSQTVEVLESVLDLPVGVIGGGSFDPQQVTVGMVQTLISRVKRKNSDFLDDYKLLILDECHHTAGSGTITSWYTVSRNVPNAGYRFGVSATPIMKKHGLLLQAATGPLIHKVSMRELQEKGFIAHSLAYFVPLEISLDSEEWLDGVYEEGIVRNLGRTQKGVEMALQFASAGDLVMVFVERIEHGKAVARQLEGIGTEPKIEWVFLSGEDERDYIEEVKAKAKKKEIGILVVTRKLFGEGVDIPAVDVLINLAGGKSDILFTQMFGRGLRMSEGKERLTYVDFTDEDDGYLEDHAKERMAHCGRLGQEVIRGIPFDEGATDVNLYEETAEED